MTLRAADNQEIELVKLIREIRTVFKEKYNWFNNNKCFKISSLCKHGAKGIAIWLAYNSYRINAFLPILLLYKNLEMSIKY